MIPNQNLIIEALTRYAKGEPLSGAQAKLLEAWFNESEDNRKLAELFREGEQARADVMDSDPQGTRQMWAELERSLDEAGIGKKWKRMVMWRRIGVAAMVLLCISGGGAWLIFNYAPHQVARAPDRQGGVIRSSLIAEAGSHPTKRQLPGGEVVLISGGTRLSSDYSGNTRHAVLSGQGNALFDVKGEADHPFLLETDNHASIQVLGTHFQVEVDPVKQESRVQTFTGRLHVKYNGDSMLLERGQEVVAAHGKLVKHLSIDTAALLSWSHEARAFSFRDTEFDEVIRQVACWYGCTVVTSGEVRGAPVHGDLMRSKDPDATLQDLQLIENGLVTLRREAGVIFVSAGPAK
jgi:ferric-dicitrate binding protein FerR (iron transport regulator)